MFPTVEVRWFYRGTVPAQVMAWFEQTGREPGEVAERTDHYLCIAAGDALGIKLREGKIEIKQRQRQLGISSFHERVTGQVEQWRKWSLPLAGSIDPRDERLFPPGSWIDVQKKRRLRRYHLANNQQHEIGAGGNWPFQGCHLELTELGLLGEPYWSISLEAFGAEDTLQTSLALIAGHIVAANLPPVLDLDNSYGYPRWLELARNNTKGES